MEMKKSVFVVHSWNFANASLYPPIADGVEYLDGFIDILRDVCKKQSYDLRMDNLNFLAGKTVRENLEREISNADIVLVFLDGLRPNVVYEMGFAYGLNMGKKLRKVVCLHEKNATVLVRSFYQDPRNVKTTSGLFVTIQNPPLDVSKHLSDNSDLLKLIYDRNDPRGFEKSLIELFDSFESAGRGDAIIAEMEKSKTWENENADVENVGAPSVNKNENIRKELWDLYKNGDYGKIITYDSTALPNIAKKTLAMSYMHMKMYSQAIEIFKILLKDGKIRSSASYFMGLCFYSLEMYSECLISLLRAWAMGYEPQGENASINSWVELAAKKLDASEIVDIIKASNSIPPSSDDEDVE